MKLGYTIPYVESVAEAFSASGFGKGLPSIPFETAAPGQAAPPLELGLVTESVEADFERAIAAGAVLVKTSPAQARRSGIRLRARCIP